MERWLVAIRDDPRRPPSRQVHVLAMLALRMNWETGSGFASGQQLAADADADERTVRRATRWAREAGYVMQTRRGHRMGNGGVVASEWKLSQPDTPVLLSPAAQPDGEAISTGLHNTPIKSPLHQES